MRNKAGHITILRWTILFYGIYLNGGDTLSVHGQNGQSQTAREQRLIIEVKARQLELGEARAALDRAKELFAEGLVSRTALEQAQAKRESALLSYQQAVLTVLTLSPRISIQEAILYHSPDGRLFVRLKVGNQTPAFDDSRFRLLSDFEGTETLPSELRTRDLKNVFISLRHVGGNFLDEGEGTRGTTIALPYEFHIKQLGFGETETITFQLLKNVDSVTVFIVHKDQKQEIDIQLQQDQSDRIVSLSTIQLSQEGDLGSAVTYSLRLHRSSIKMKAFMFRVLNLPHAITYTFLDPDSQARVSQVSFPLGVTEKNLHLRLFLPERADATVPTDEPLVFWVVVLEESRVDRLAEDRLYTPHEIEQSKAGSLRLEIICRGRGRIQVSAPSLFSQIHAGDMVESPLIIRNTGTRRVDTIRLVADEPLGWKVEIVPEIVEYLEVGQEKEVTLRIVPDQDVAIGDYEVRIRMESYAYNREVPAEDKIYRVSVRGRTNLGRVGVLLVLVVLIFSAIVVAGIRLSRN